MAVDAATTGRDGGLRREVYTGRVARCARRQRDDGLRWLEEGGGEPGTA